MRPHLRAGVAIYNEGRPHAAHDAWEDRWLELGSGTDEERLLHGLIQFTAVAHHVEDGNWSGARGLAESAGEYLADLPETFIGVDLDAVRPFLERVAADPEAVERIELPALTHEGTRLTYEDLDFEATAVAASVLAAEEGYDEDLMDRAVAEARAEVEDGRGGQFSGLVFAFVREPEKRGVIAQRLGQHVERERSRERDVEGLFD